MLQSIFFMLNKSDHNRCTTEVEFILTKKISDLQFSMLCPVNEHKKLTCIMLLLCDLMKQD